MTAHSAPTCAHASGTAKREPQSASGGERWLPIHGYEDYYEVSDLGRVRSLPRKVRAGNGYRLIPARILAQAAVRIRRDGKSRKIVTLCRDCAGRWSRVPHLVLTAFKGARPSRKHESRHLNGDTSDNRAVNLEWGTQKENQADTTRLDQIWRGEQHGGAKLTVEQVREIRGLRAAGVSGPRIAARFGITPPLVYFIEKRKAWKHA